MARSRGITFAVLMVALAPTEVAAKAPVAATAPTPEQKARKLYLEGEAAFAAGRYLDAIKSFEDAYQTAHVTKLLWNIAQSWRHQYAISGDVADLRRASMVLHSYRDLAKTEEDRKEAHDELAEVEAGIRAEDEKARAAAAVVATAAAAQSVLLADAQARTARKSRMKLAGVVTGVAGLAMLGGGIGCTVLAQAAFHEINEPADKYVFNPQTESNLHLYRPLGGALLGVGLAAVATGATLLALGSREHAPAVTIAPTFGAAAAGLLAAGAF